MHRGFSLCQNESQFQIRRDLGISSVQSDSSLAKLARKKNKYRRNASIFSGISPGESIWIFVLGRDVGTNA